MLDECDLSQEKKWYYEQLVKKCAKEIEQKNISVHHARDREEARSIVLGLIPEGATTGFGDSMTLRKACIGWDLIPIKGG